MSDADREAQQLASVVLGRWGLRLRVLEALYWSAEGAVYRPTAAHQELAALVGEMELRATERLLTAAELVQPAPDPAGALALTHMGLALIEAAILDPQLRTPFGSLAAARALDGPMRSAPRARAGRGGTYGHRDPV